MYYIKIKCPKSQPEMTKVCFLLMSILADGSPLNDRGANIRNIFHCYWRGKKSSGGLLLAAMLWLGNSFAHNSLARTGH